MLNEDLSLESQIKIYTARANESYNRAMAARLCGDFKTAEFHMARYLVHSNYVSSLTRKLMEEEERG